MPLWCPNGPQTTSHWFLGFDFHAAQVPKWIPKANPSGHWDLIFRPLWCSSGPQSKSQWPLGFEFQATLVLKWARKQIHVAIGIALIDAKTARTGWPRLSGQSASSLAPPASRIGCAGSQHSKEDWSTVPPRPTLSNPKRPGPQAHPQAPQAPEARRPLRFPGQARLPKPRWSLRFCLSDSVCQILSVRCFQVPPDPVQSPGAPIDPAPKVPPSQAPRQGVRARGSSTPRNSV